MFANLKVLSALVACSDPTLADAILDRIVHNAYRIKLAGESLRKRHAAQIAE